MFFKMKNSQCLLTQNMIQNLHILESKSLDLEYFLNRSFDKHLLNANNVLADGDLKKVK